jgi:hypothetical protein
MDNQEQIPDDALEIGPGHLEVPQTKDNSMKPRKRRGTADEWMRQYLTPGNHLITWIGDTYRGRAGKVVFLVPSVKTNIGQKKRVTSICVCDVVEDPETKEIYRKAAPRQRQAGMSGGGKTTVGLYEQLFVPLDNVEEVTHNMRILAGCKEAAKAKARLEEVTKSIEQTEEERKRAEQCRRFRL